MEELSALPESFECPDCGGEARGNAYGVRCRECGVELERMTDGAVQTSRGASPARCWARRAK